MSKHTKLTDLEICKRIAEIEGAVETLITNTDKTLTALFKNRTSFGYNPLTDDALCFKLMVKHKVEAEFYPDDTVDARVTDLTISRVRNNVTGENLNHAVCLAIIEAHKNG